MPALSSKLVPVSELPVGEQVRVYRNLRTGGFSIKANIDGAWKVISHAEEVFLTSCIFVVKEAGRIRRKITTIAGMILKPGC